MTNLDFTFLYDKFAVVTLSDPVNLCVNLARLHVINSLDFQQML
jgi:hypothetical protein